MLNWALIEQCCHEDYEKAERMYRKVNTAL
jgi:hypothetical protein